MEEQPEERDEERIEETILNLLQRLEQDLERFKAADDQQQVLQEIKLYVEDIIKDEQRLEKILIERDKEIKEFENMLLMHDQVENLIEDEEKTIRNFHVGFAKVIQDLRLVFTKIHTISQENMLQQAEILIKNLIQLGQHILKDEEDIDQAVKKPHS